MLPCRTRPVAWSFWVIQLTSPGLPLSCTPLRERQASGGRPMQAEVHVIIDDEDGGHWVSSTHMAFGVPGKGAVYACGFREPRRAVVHIAASRACISRVSQGLSGRTFRNRLQV